MYDNGRSVVPQFHKYITYNFLNNSSATDITMRYSAKNRIVLKEQSFEIIFIFRNAIHFYALIIECTSGKVLFAKVQPFYDYWL